MNATVQCSLQLVVPLVYNHITIVTSMTTINCYQSISFYLEFLNIAGAQNKQSHVMLMTCLAHHIQTS